MKILCFILLSIYALANPQQLSQKPQDRAIKVKLHTGEVFCYRPVFTSDDGFVYLDHCNKAPAARYDVFGRIAWHINNQWLCMTAPSSVTGIGGKQNKDSDYVVLRPCTINDPNQRWIVKNNALYISNFRLKDVKWYAYLSKKPKSNHDHILVGMQNWIDTAATPVNLSIKTSIAWSFASPSQFSLYFLQKNQSHQDHPIEMLYNPENGHIAQYNPSNGSKTCLTSKQDKQQDWNWAAWEDCNDKVMQEDHQYWEFFMLTNHGGALRDKNGNFLRIAQNGPKWGVPYTAKPSYLQKDKTHAPKSLFSFSKDIEDWNGYVNANLGNSLPYCPASGDYKKHTSPSIGMMPSTFVLTQEWIRRLWQIATTTDAQKSSDECKICLLQTYQMIAELQTHHTPLQDGGYFFDTTQNTNPFRSFKQRYPILESKLQEIKKFLDIPLTSTENLHTRTIRGYHSIALTMLPNYRWETSNFFDTKKGIEQFLSNLFNAPVGSLWIAHLYLKNSHGNYYGHTIPILRLNDGLYFIPTNTHASTSLSAYSDTLLNRSFARNTNEAMKIISAGGNVRILFTMRPIEASNNPLFMMLSNHSCIGDGAGRRGNKSLPTSQSVNQCNNQRCMMQ